ncbi:MAG: DUF882 domain-containing protein [Deltaproteobacteria bacterium]|jgi:uncharacterized protein YcbK (DUF882 family)|nr:DUF882 domain-containing protein [Deltaproteobacteria bacterium]MBW2533377.1 DUF882 domain-containing protein [Deltaproteobacteria bacterium]
MTAAKHHLDGRRTCARAGRAHRGAAGLSAAQGLRPRKPALQAALIGLLLGGAGCAATPDDWDADATADRAAAAGKADGAGLPGTCGELTSGQSPDGCFCDDECCSLGDCCQDRMVSCGGSAGGDTGGGDATSSGDGPCFLGPARDGARCLPAVALPEPTPAGQIYPSECEPSYGASYRSPDRYLDLQQLDGSTVLSPSFTLNDIAQAAETDRYLVFQPHALARLQDLSDRVGALQLISTYRSPSWNASYPGRATCSRHMWGDAVDMIPLEATAGELEAACRQLSASFTQIYPEYDMVHCDWRNVPLDPAFFP